MGFDIAFSNVLTTLLYILPGYVVCKAGKMKAEHLPTLSGLLIYGCSPCLVVSTLFGLDYSAENIRCMLSFFLASLVLQGIFMGAVYLILRRKFDDARYRIMTIGSVLGNVGFFGLPVIRSLLPDNPEVAAYATVFMISMNVYVFTMAVYCLTREKKYMTLKAAVINPSTVAFLIGLVFYLTQTVQYIPSLLLKVISVLGNMTTPLCMLILGVRLANVSLPRLFTRPFVYAVCALKLLVYPLVSYGLISLFPVADSFRYTVLILCGAPCAAIVLSMAEMYDAQQELTANCLLLSTLLSVVTIPLLTLIV